MKKGNVLVIGNSGVGKSTLINAVLGENVAVTNWGNEGTTKELKIYENDEVPFRVVDTVGFEPSFLKELQAVRAVQQWSKESAKEGHGDKQISTIWFCVEGTSSKLFDKTIRDLANATRMWESVPIVAVITKSYAIPERSNNIQMVNNAFARLKMTKNLKCVIPVVASTYTLNDTAFAPPEGIAELIEITNQLMPEGIRAGQKDIDSYKLSRKQVMSQSLIGAAVAGGVVVGAATIGVPDGVILTPVEIGMVNGLASIYGLAKDEKTSQFVNSIISAGAVGMAAKTTLNAIKLIPGVNVAGSILNAVVAGVFVMSIGETSKYLFEQVYLGNKTLDDIDWAKKIIESKLTDEAAGQIGQVIKSLGGQMDVTQVIKLIRSLMNKKDK